MRNTSKIGTKHAQKTAVSNSPMVIDFGTRTISTQNFSKIVALPKTALTNCGKECTKVNVKLVQQDGEKFLKLTPIAKEGKEIE
jgi:hypothetical protein